MATFAVTNKPRGTQSLPPCGLAAFAAGMKAGLPIAIGYLPIAITFGLLAKSAGLPNVISALMSFAVYAGASQFIAVQLFSLGTLPWEIILTTFIINLRHLLMSAAISQRLPARLGKGLLAGLAFGITDETFSVAALQADETLPPAFLAGLNLIAFAAWNIGTWGGLFFATAVPPALQAGMGIALYAMFIGLLVPSCLSERPVLVVSLLAIAFHTGLRYLPWIPSLSTGWTIIIATMFAAALGAFLFPQEVQEDA
ncbi:MAG TPA: branched-chain amino acid ABC transporter permease [Firmicutes bacterium]|jgi:4-azaleucine resistance transporter AzlC|nr:branched-chain amino acid ABC transporter permease [Bacillota bacterium]